MVEFGVPAQPGAQAALARPHARGAAGARPRWSRPPGTRSAASWARTSSSSTPTHPDLTRLWTEAGIEGVTRRGDELRRRPGHVGGQRRRPHLSAPRLQRPAFYALAPGGWRDLVTLLHPPYTAWHLSYVALGAAAAPRDPRRPARRRARRVLPGGRDRRPRARRAPRAPAPDPAEPRHADRAGRHQPRRSGGDRRRGRHHHLGVAGAPGGPRRVPGRRLQPRAVRGPRPRRRVVRAGLGRVPGLHRLLRQRAPGPPGRACWWRARAACSALPSGA